MLSFNIMKEVGMTDEEMEIKKDHIGDIMEMIYDVAVRLSARDDEWVDTGTEIEVSAIRVQLHKEFGIPPPT